MNLLYDDESCCASDFKRINYTLCYEIHVCKNVTCITDFWIHSVPRQLTYITIKSVFHYILIDESLSIGWSNIVLVRKASHFVDIYILMHVFSTLLHLHNNVSITSFEHIILSVNCVYFHISEYLFIFVRRHPTWK